MPANSKILITGADGFIGRHLVSELRKQGRKVVAVTKKDCDIANEKAVTDLFAKEKPGIVFHLAAYVPEGQVDEKKLLSVNILGVLNILKASVKHGVKKLVYSSSASVYARKGAKLPLKESDTAPENIYGLSKLAGEQLCELFSRTHNLAVVCLRYGSVYGAGQRQDSVLPVFIQKAKAAKPITIFNGGKRSQDFVYIKDVVQANIKAAFSNARGVFNIASGKETSMKDLAESIADIFSENRSKVINEKSASDNSRFYLNISKAKKDLKFKPKFSLHQGLEDYKKNI